MIYRARTPLHLFMRWVEALKDTEMLGLLDFPADTFGVPFNEAPTFLTFVLCEFGPVLPVPVARVLWCCWAFVELSSRPSRLSFFRLSDRKEFRRCFDIVPKGSF